MSETIDIPLSALLLCRNGDPSFGAQETGQRSRADLGRTVPVTEAPTGDEPDSGSFFLNPADFTIVNTGEEDGVAFRALDEGVEFNAFRPLWDGISTVATLNPGVEEGRNEQWKKGPFTSGVRLDGEAQICFALQRRDSAGHGYGSDAPSGNPCRDHRRRVANF